MADLPRGVVTFLFTDIEGSTRLVKQLRERWGRCRRRTPAVPRQAPAHAPNFQPMPGWVANMRLVPGRTERMRLHESAHVTWRPPLTLSVPFPVMVNRQREHAVLCGESAGHREHAAQTMLARCSAAFPRRTHQLLTNVAGRSCAAPLTTPARKSAPSRRAAVQRSGKKGAKLSR